MPPGGAGNRDEKADAAAASDDSVTEATPIETAEIADAPTTAVEESTSAVDTEAVDTQAVDDTEGVDTEVEDTEAVDTEAVEPAPKPKRSVDWKRVLAYGILPGLALILAMAAGYLKWQDDSVRDSQRAQAEASQTAKDSTVKMLSYKPDTVDKDLNGARDLLTGDFRDQYTSLINDVVIPGAQQKKISAVATVPAIGAVSADPHQAVVLLFVNQTVVVGQDAPTDTASSVRVTLEKVGDRWLISKFDPV
jgi:Mce-associated membrane protein